MDAATDTVSSEGNLVEFVAFLFRRFHDSGLQRQLSQFAMEFAAMYGQLEVIRYLLERIPDVTQRDSLCLSALESANNSHNINLTNFLIQQIVDKELSKVVTIFMKSVADLNMLQECFDSIAEFKRGNAHTEFVPSLMRAIPDHKLRKSYCCKLARMAAAFGDLSLVTLFVQGIPSQNDRNEYCKVAAKSAAEFGRLDLAIHCIQMLSDRRQQDQYCEVCAKISVENNRIEAVLNISSNNQIDVGIDKAILDQFRQAVVASSIQLSKFEVVEVIGVQPMWLLRSDALLKHISGLVIVGKVSKTFYDSLSQTQPKDIAQLVLRSISAGHIALAVDLLAHLSVEHVDLPDSSGSTALMLAADAGHHELIEELLQKRASVCKTDNQGRTALSRAYHAGHVRASKALIEGGADVNHRDTEGLTCRQLAEKSGHSPVMQLLHFKTERVPDVICRIQQSALSAFSIHQLPDRHNAVDYSKKMSSELHRLLNAAGFTQERVKYQQKMANLVQGIAQIIAQDDRQLAGSFAEGWGNTSIAHLNSMDWITSAAEQLFHLEGGCDGKRSECRNVSKLKVIQGHAQVTLGSGSQLAIKTAASGVRPAENTFPVYACCSSFGRKLPDVKVEKVQLLRGTRRNMRNELRLGFSHTEKKIVMNLNGIQGQLLVVLKFIFNYYLPRQMRTTELKTYHAKTIVLFLKSETHTEWKPHNLLKLVAESIDMLLKFISSSDSDDECMPHFFIQDAPIYFKNAGLGTESQSTKARIVDQLSALKSDLSEVVKQLKSRVKPLTSKNFHFHPFTLMPLTPPPTVTEIRENGEWEHHYDKFADVYCMVYQCLTQLHSELCDKENLMRLLKLLAPVQWCTCTTQCLTAMAHLKFGETSEAANLMRNLVDHKVQIGWSPSGIENKKYDKHFGHWYCCPEDSDWAWRFCLPCTTQPHFPFLPEFTQTLFTARLEQPRSRHLYVNFRCLGWSLQAELLSSHVTLTTSLTSWFNEMQEDPDLEELLTLANYSDCREHLEFCLDKMKTLRDERRVVIETQDEEKFERVRAKLERVLSEARVVTARVGDVFYAMDMDVDFDVTASAKSQQQVQTEEQRNSVNIRRKRTHDTI